jgi:PadR family transcriptional regulator, regulatory protein PadR
MERNRKPSAQTVAVLLALSESPSKWRYGYDLSQETGLKAGSMYPILMRLADRGLLETSWESDPPVGRPPRHLYRLTGTGRAAAKELAVETRSAADGHVVRSATRALRPGLEGTS